MRFLFCLLLAFCLALSVQGRVFAVIDSFATIQAPLIFTVQVGGDTPDNDVWYSPYSTIHPPVAAYTTTTNCLGGQRDIVIGYETVTPVNSVAVASVTAKSGSVSLPLDYAGGVYFQYDGVDNGGTQNPFPGATLNSLPGIGSANNAFANADARSMDFTFGGRAKFVTVTIFADHECSYFFDAIDTSDRLNTFAQNVVPVSETQAVVLFVAFQATGSAGWSNSAFDFTHVAGFQVRVFTFQDQGSAQAVDTSFKFLNITGYEILGTVVVDCACDGSPDSFVSGATITLSIPNGATLATTTTDVNGAFAFYGRDAGTYRVCIPASLTRCGSTPQCSDVTLANLVDPLPLTYFTTISSVLTPPVDKNLECGACTTTVCNGVATLSGCSGTTPVNTFNDFPTTSGCVTTIRRTFTSGSQSVTQTITLTDTQNPVITTPAQSLTFPCNAVTTPITTWITNNGNAVATDCSTISWSNNWDQTPPIQCGFDTVTFTVRDACAHTAVTTATYTITDNTPPNISTVATNARAECDLRTGTDQVALNAWIASRGGAIATDNCGTIIWTNDFVPPLNSGCNNFRTVTFTANDGCAAVQRTTATFTISDTTPPTITVSAQSSSTQCAVGTSAQAAFDAWRTTHGGAQATDACISSDNLLTWTDNFSGTVTGGCNNAFTVTFTVHDQCSFTASTTAAFSITDNTGPTLVTPAQPLSIECGTANIQTSYTNWLNNNGGATATDSCTSVVWSNNAGPAPTDGCNSVSTVTFRATDTCNNAAVQTTATFSVRDTIPPTFSIPPSNSGQECSGNVQVAFSTWLSSNANSQASDSCSNPTRITNDFPTNGTPAVGCNAVTTVRFVAVDNCGNQSGIQTATFTVTDTTAPVINPGAVNTSVECNTSTNGQDYASFLASHGGAVATDFCSTFVWTNDGPSSLSFVCTIAQTVTFTARDVCNNAAVTTSTFSIADNNPPVIQQQATDRITQCSQGGSQTDITSWLNSRGGAVATDTCGPVAWTNNYSGSLTVIDACNSIATVTFTAADGCGHAVATTASFSVTDSIGPTINPPAQALTVQCDPSTQNDSYNNWINTHGGAQATDNCVASANLIWVASQPVPLTDKCGSQSVTFTVADGCGSTSSTTAIFTIIDTAKPTFINPPQDKTVECDGAGNTLEYNTWVSSFAEAVADDVCATVLTYASNAPANGPVGCGTQPQTITVTDECNNAAIASSIFRVDDTQPPTILTPATDSAIQCNPSTNPTEVQAFLTSHGGAEAADICYATSSLQWKHNFVGLSDALCNPTARVTFTVTDPCGNFASTTASITIVDTLVPILSSAATPVVLECNIETNQQSISTYVNTHGGAQATDSCSSITWTNNYISGPNPCIGPLPIIFIATDACGNHISSSGSIEIIDSVPPEFINFPDDVHIGCDQCKEPECTGVPSWNDACTADIVPAYSDISFQKPTEKFCPGDIIITRTWTIIDDCGNVNSRDQMIVEEIARSTGPCLPSECPPCELVECCTVPLPDIECNPVPCTPVACESVHCSAVPCIPRSCGVPPTPTGKPEGPVPLPSVLPAPSCEPVYIYVFDDDGEDVPVDPIINYTTQNDSTTLGVSLISLLIILFVTIF